MENVPPSALRQPPPPGRRVQLIDSNAKPAPTPSRVRNRQFYFRKCKKLNTSNSMIHSNSMIESLPVPDELVMEILVRLSADEIFDNARLVCRRWRHLIHTDAFVSTHLQRASSGLLLTPFLGFCGAKKSPVLVITTTQGRVKMSKLSCRINFPIMCSCNGLALCVRNDGPRVGGNKPFIFNPATKSAFDLPRFPVTGKLLRILLIRVACHGFVMAYAASSMAYKVVGTYDNSEGVAQCCILTVGVDNTWRHVALEGLSPKAINTMMKNTSLMTRGFLHWVSKTLVVSLNVEFENFTVTPTPALMFPQGTKTRYYPLSTGEYEYLSVLIPCGELSWEVWEMKAETWEWRKMLPNIDLEAHKYKIQEFASKKDDVLKPVGWVRYPEVLAFFFQGRELSCIIYNLYTEEFESIELPFPDARHSVVHHMNSLVWSERC